MSPPPPTHTHCISLSQKAYCESAPDTELLSSKDCSHLSSSSHIFPNKMGWGVLWILRILISRCLIAWFPESESPDIPYLRAALLSSLGGYQIYLLSVGHSQECISWFRMQDPSQGDITPERRWWNDGTPESAKLIFFLKGGSFRIGGGGLGMGNSKGMSFLLFLFVLRE